MTGPHGCGYCRGKEIDMRAYSGKLGIRPPGGGGAGENWIFG